MLNSAALDTHHHHHSIMLTVGVIGCGYWGPNLIRNYAQLPDVKLKWVADLRAERLAHIAQLYPNVKTTKDAQEIIRDTSVDAVVIATPPQTHLDLGAAAIKAGKHCFIEKPLALSVKDSQTLIDLAAAGKRTLMTGHTFLYNPAIRYLKGLIDQGELGKLHYIRCQRLSLGLYQQTCNVVWDLAPHDVSVAMYFLNGERPKRVACTAGCHIRPGTEDVANITLEFPSGVISFIQVSWLDPNKVRQITLCGQRKMALYDDVEPQEKIRLYDKAVEVPAYADTFGDWQYSYRYGDITIPNLKLSEPLAIECKHFVDCIVKNEKPMSSGEEGLAVIQVLEAIAKSLKNGSAFVPV